MNSSVVSVRRRICIVPYIRYLFINPKGVYHPDVSIVYIWILSIKLRRICRDKMLEILFYTKNCKNTNLRRYMGPGTRFCKKRLKTGIVGIYHCNYKGNLPLNLWEPVRCEIRPILKTENQTCQFQNKFRYVSPPKAPARVNYPLVRPPEVHYTIAQLDSDKFRERIPLHLRASGYVRLY